MNPPIVNILVPLLVLVVGVLVYALSGSGAPPSNQSGKVAELGRVAYFVGLFWLVAVFAHEVARL